MTVWLFDGMEKLAYSNINPQNLVQVTPNILSKENDAHNQMQMH